MSVVRIASRYAKSLIDLAVDKNELERVKEDVDSFIEVVKVRDFYLLLKSPIVKGDKKLTIVKELFEGKFHEITMAFLRILIKKGREAYLPEIAKEFTHQYKVLRKISTVKITTAKALNEEVLKAIRGKLQESSSTYQNLEIITEVKPELLGGFLIEYDDKLYDASIKHKLELIKKDFKDNLYVSKIIAG